MSTARSPILASKCLSNEKGAMFLREMVEFGSGAKEQNEVGTSFCAKKYRISQRLVESYRKDVEDSLKVFLVAKIKII